jgi:hypothetical protein
MTRIANLNVSASMLSRRRIIIGSAGVAAGLLSVRANSQTPKIPKATAGYQDSPNNGQSCSGCEHFMAPASCALVDGAVSPQGWCKLFAQKS